MEQAKIVHRAANKRLVASMRGVRNRVPARSLREPKLRAMIQSLNVLISRMLADRDGVQNSSELRERSEKIMYECGISGAVPPGSYTENSLPPLSPNAKAILDEVYAAAPLRLSEKLSRTADIEKGNTAPKTIGVIDNGHPGLFYKP